MALIDQTLDMKKVRVFFRGFVFLFYHIEHDVRVNSNVWYVHLLCCFLIDTQTLHKCDPNGTIVVCSVLSPFFNSTILVATLFSSHCQEISSRFSALHLFFFDAIRSRFRLFSIYHLRGRGI